MTIMMLWQHGTGSVGVSVGFWIWLRERVTSFENLRFVFCIRSIDAKDFGMKRLHYKQARQITSMRGNM